MLDLRVQVKGPMERLGHARVARLLHEPAPVVYEDPIGHGSRVLEAERLEDLPDLTQIGFDGNVDRLHSGEGVVLRTVPLRHRGVL